MGRGIPDGDAAAMPAHQTAHHIEAEPGAGMLPGLLRAAAVEAVEYLLTLIGRYAGPLVGDFQFPMVAEVAHARADRGARRCVFGGILEQVLHDAPEGPGVGVHVQGLRKVRSPGVPTGIAQPRAVQGDANGCGRIEALLAQGHLAFPGGGVPEGTFAVVNGTVPVMTDLHAAPDGPPEGRAELAPDTPMPLLAVEAGDAASRATGAAGSPTARPPTA